MMEADKTVPDKIIDEIIKTYFNKDNILTDHQISSYNDLIENILPNIINQLFPLTVNINNDKFDTITLNVIHMDIESPKCTENNGTSTLMYPYMAKMKKKRKRA